MVDSVEVVVLGLALVGFALHMEELQVTAVEIVNLVDFVHNLVPECSDSGYGGELSAGIVPICSLYLESEVDFQFGKVVVAFNFYYFAKFYSNFRKNNWLK